jgi:hypothetical protein
MLSADPLFRAHFSEELDHGHTGPELHSATGILDTDIPCAAEQASIDVAAPQLVGDSQWITHIFYRDGVRYCGLTGSRTTIPPRSDFDGFSYGPMLFRAPTRRHSRGIRSPKVDLFGGNRPRPGIRARRLSANIRGIADASRSASKAAAIYSVTDHDGQLVYRYRIANEIELRNSGIAVAYTPCATEHLTLERRR